jgi:hypothetical protein
LGTLGLLAMTFSCFGLQAGGERRRSCTAQAATPAGEWRPRADTSG